jgi:hypothetical protein
VKLTAILKEVESNRDREMVTGVADILKRIKDEQNRRELADRMMKQFDRERVQYDEEEFLKMAKVKRELKEIGFTNKKDYGFKYDVTGGSENIAEYEFSTGDNTYKVWVRKKESDGIQQGWILEIAFAVMENDKPQFPGHKPHMLPNFDKEVNDPKNMYRIMATVVNIGKEEMAWVEKSGENVIRIEFEPTKREIVGKTGIKTKDPNDTRRANLYMAYLKKEFPDSEIKSTANYSKIWVDLYK